jgi:hypothetical protein
MFNLFTLLYGDLEIRLSHLDKETRAYILRNIQKDQEKGLGASKNEFEHVNRGNYKNFIISSYNKDVGRHNWVYVFKQVFAPLTENDVKDFLDMFAEFNIVTSHIKQGAFGAEQQTRILDYVLKSMDIIKKINQTYLTLIEKGLYVVETLGPTRLQFLFSLSNLTDKDSLTPIFVKTTNAQRVAEQLLRERSISIDLEDTQFIESRFSITYREFMAIIARLLMQLPIEAKKTGLRVTIESFRGSSVNLNITKI